MSRARIKVPEAEALQIGSRIGNAFMEINDETGSKNLAMVRTFEPATEKPRDLDDFKPIEVGMRLLRLFSIAPQLLVFAWKVLAIESQIGERDSVVGPQTDLIEEARSMIEFVEGKPVFGRQPKS